MKPKILGLLAVGLMAGPIAANAAPIKWTVSGLFDDGGTLSGSFTVETDTNSMVDWSIVTTSGSTLPGFTYDMSSSGFFGFNVFATNPNSVVLYRIDPFAQPYIQLGFTSSLFTPGTISLDTTGFDAGSWECNNCDPSRFLTSGTATSVPEPGTLALLGLGLAGLGLSRRRKAH